MRRSILAAMTCVTALLAASPARALEAVCIEASRYKHLHQLFDGDPRKFAAYLQLDPARLPSPEHCRAALVTGPIVLNAGDLDKLVDVVLRNQGWLSELYLASSGGSIVEAMRLGFVVRAFWLKTRTLILPKGQPLAYRPDFALDPDETEAEGAARGGQGPTAEGYRAYAQAVRSLPPQFPASGGCASACGLLHTAGIDRDGDVFVHRPRYIARGDPARAGPSETERGAPGPMSDPPAPAPPRAGGRIDTSKSMADTDRGLRRSEALNIAFYQEMDAGADFIRAVQATSTLTASPAAASRFPRFVADFLAAKCETDADELRRLEARLRLSIAEALARSLGLQVATATASLRQALGVVRVRRLRAERCVASAHERERLSVFDRQCRGGCDHAALVAMASARLREMRDRLER